MIKFYKIETDRLIIRCYELEDAPLLLEALRISKPELLPWMVWAQDLPGTLEEKRQQVNLFREQFDSGEDYSFAIIDKSNGDFIGSTGLHTRLGKDVREIGYWINSLHTGKGYALEASTALVKAGFELHKARRIEIHCDPKNIRSQRIPNKLNFVLQKPDSKKTKAGQDQVWTLSKTEYDKLNVPGTELNAFDRQGTSIKFPPGIDKK